MTVRQEGSQRSGNPQLSIVVPFFNEEQNIRHMHAAISGAMSPLPINYEMVFVDDGSRDATFAVAQELARADPHVRVVKFRRNYGQTAAMAAGIEQARGEVIVTMDGDLQNDPGDIPLFLEKIEEGNDIVVGWRFNRQDKLVSRKIPSRIANALIARITGVPIRDNGCSLKAYRASLIKEIPLYSEMHRFIPAMANIAGPRIAEIKVRHHARRFGTSKYGISRVYKVLLDILVIKTVAAFCSRPLLWFSILSVPLLMLALLALAATIYVFAAGGGLSLPFAGSSLIFLASSVIVLLSGALGELIYSLGDLREYEFSRLTEQVRQFDSAQRG